MKLDRLEAAVSVKDLAALPGNRFEALSGDRKGQYSIRINDASARSKPWASARHALSCMHARVVGRTSAMRSTIARVSAPWA